MFTKPGRLVLIAVATCAVVLAGCGAPGQPLIAKPAPHSVIVGTPQPFVDPAAAVAMSTRAPLALRILDVAGQQQVLKMATDRYVEAHPDKVSKIDWIRGTVPDLVKTISAEQTAGVMETTIVSSGLDGLSLGLKSGLWQQLRPNGDDRLPPPEDIYQAPALQVNALSKGSGVLTAYTPSGPLLAYSTAHVTTAPHTPQELLDWARQNPGKFLYARPSNSGPGRTFVMGLPYLLGDTDPRDPVNGWDRTWAYLKELDHSIDYYPTGTALTMKELAAGTRWIIPTTAGWDVNQRAIGTLPGETGVALLTGPGARWVADGLFLLVPRGLDADRLALALDLMTWTLQPEQQATTYESGYFYPGPAVRGVTAAMVPPDARALIAEFSRPEVDTAMAAVPVAMPLDPDQMNAMFNKWDLMASGKFTNS